MSIIQIILSALLSVAVLVGISMMSKVKTSVNGNLLSALAMLVGVVATLLFSGVVSAWTIYPAIIIGALIGSVMARKVQMIQMPQVVALFNGLGGGASAFVGILSASGMGFSSEQLSEIAMNGYEPFVQFTSLLAIAVGMITLVGSLVAAGKLHRVLPQKPIVWQNHSAITMLLLILTVACIIAGIFVEGPSTLLIIGSIVFSALFGLFFSIRVGGADMPITISLLNSLSGVAGSIAGMAISDIFLVAVGGIVGASGLLLTQIMCRAMNRSLLKILIPPTVPAPAQTKAVETNQQDEEYKKQLENRVMQLEERIKKLEAIVSELEARVGTLNAQMEATPATAEETAAASPASVLAAAKDVIIVPGYGMALAQAQHLVKQLADTLESNGARVRFAIHPVAGRVLRQAVRDGSHQRRLCQDRCSCSHRCQRRAEPCRTQCRGNPHLRHAGTQCGRSTRGHHLQLRPQAGLCWRGESALHPRERRLSGAGRCQANACSPHQRNLAKDPKDPKDLKVLKRALP